MHSKCIVAALVIVSILFTGSCSFLSLSDGKANFIYGEGTSPLSRSDKLAKAIAAGNSRVDIAEQIIKRYNRYHEVFIIESGLSKESKAVLQFDSIVQEFSPKPGTVDIQIKDTETVKEEAKKKAGKLQVKVISRMHIGSADKTLLEKIEENTELVAEFKKTQLYGKMKKNINKYEKYITKKK